MELKQNNMKTPMIMMIQNIIDVESKTNNQEQLYMLNALKIGALLLLEKEKEQIIDAYLVGADYSTDADVTAAKKYYNEKYQNK